MLVLLFIFTLFWTICVFLLSEDDFLFPPLILNMALIIGILFCFYNFDDWEMETYHLKTIGVIIAAVVPFTIASLFVQRSYIGNPKTVRLVVPISRYFISNRTICGVTLSSMTVTGMYFKEIYQVGMAAKERYGGDLPLLWYVRNAGGSREIGLLLNSLSDFTYIMGFIFLYCFVYNFVSTGKVKNNLKLLFPVMVYIVQSVLYGGRTGFLKLACSAMVCYYYASVKKKWIFQGYKQVNKKVLKIFPLMIIITLTVFVLLSSISGRPTSDDSFRAGIYTVSVYLGSGLKNLDTFLSDGAGADHFWGAETFGGIYTTLVRFTGMKNMEGILALPFQPKLNGLFMGNVYTAVRRYYSDFGISGVIILSAVFGAVITGLAKRCKYDYLSSKGNYEADIIVYSWFYYAIIIFWSEDFFYTNGFIVDSLLKIIEVYVFMYVMTKRRFIKRVSI